MPDPRALEALLAQGKDSSVLRFSLAMAYLETDPARAIEHFKVAVNLDPNYSAAWKMLGKALAAAARPAEAQEAYRQGIAAAERKGDVQAAKEMKVFLKRLTPQQY